ncbi:MAG TPA: glucosamine-6-phosphate deaminase [Burkholderiales bacterium]|nr:glucosamine-6-phosphate deaminase [Burkholderiales bacterium]
MTIRLFADKEALGREAAADAARLIREALADRGEARILAATGRSQFEFLDALTSTPDIAWPRVEMFHLDEYIGLPADHPASFRKFLLERLIRPTGIERFHFLDGESEPGAVCERVGRLLAAAPVDVAFIGIGENGHIAFNDPPADFETEAPYIIVRLDEACRRQQVGEGWFGRLEDVPQHAISISVRQLLKAKAIIAVVPEARKARAVRLSLEGPVSPEVPASILRTHPDTSLYLDKDSAALLSSETIRQGLLTS